MEIVDGADPFCCFCDRLLARDTVPDFLDGGFEWMTRAEDCRDDDLTLLGCGLVIVRLIEGGGVQGFVPGDALTRGCRPGTVKEGTRGRGVDGTKGAVLWDGESVAPKMLFERAVRAEPATVGEDLRGVESR